MDVLKYVPNGLVNLLSCVAVEAVKDGFAHHLLNKYPAELLPLGPVGRHDDVVPPEGGEEAGHGEVVVGEHHVMIAEYLLRERRRCHHHAQLPPQP